MIKCVLFDLDGTLVNTIIDLGAAVDYVLNEYGIKSKWSINDYKRFVGNGARKLVDRAFEHTLNDEQLDNAFEIFKRKYNKILLDNAEAYDGVTEALDYLKSRGIKLAVVTNKPQTSATIMVESVFGKAFFDVIVGATENTPKKPDPYPAIKALEAMGCKAEEALFLGDSDVDIKTAQNAGIKSIACSWGFRSVDVLIAANPCEIIDSPYMIIDKIKRFEKI